IFEDYGKQSGRSLTAKNWAFETCRQQVGDTPYVIDMNMSDDQCLDGIKRKVDRQAATALAAWNGSIVALEQTAIDQKAGRGIHVELMAGAGYTVLPAVVLDDRIAHGYSLNVAFIRYLPRRIITRTKAMNTPSIP